MAPHWTTHTGGFLSDKEAKVAEKGNLEGVIALLKKDPRYLNGMTMGHNRTLLWSAARKNRIEVAKYLIKQGADPNIPGRYRHETYLLLKPYAIACRYKRFELAEYLLSNGTEWDIFTAAYLGRMDLVDAFWKKNKELVNLKQEADSVWEVRPIHFAICGKNAEIAQRLIEAGAEVKPFSTLLFEMAMDYDRADLVKLLLEAGADPQAVSTPEVLLNENEEITKLFFENGFTPESLNKGYWPPLLYVSRGDKGEHPEKVRTLLNYGANVNMRGPKGATALHVAAKAGFVKVIEVLIEHGADIHARRDDGLTVLEVAEKYGRNEAAEFLRELSS